MTALGGYIMQKFKVVLLEHHSGSSTEIRHGTQGLLGVHTSFTMLVL
jgi:hypothetical protein